MYDSESRAAAEGEDDADSAGESDEDSHGEGAPAWHPSYVG